MEKRRRRKTQTVAQFLRRYFLITALGVLALLAAALCLFQLGLNAGWYTPANHAEIQAQELIGKTQVQDFFDPRFPTVLIIFFSAMNSGRTVPFRPITPWRITAIIPAAIPA